MGSGRIGQDSCIQVNYCLAEVGGILKSFRKYGSLFLYFVVPVEQLNVLYRIVSEFMSQNLD